MSTKFVEAYEKSSGVRAGITDSDFPLSLFKALESLQPEGKQFDPNDYKFTLVNYKGDVLEENWDWRKAFVHVTLGDLYDRK